MSEWEPESAEEHGAGPRGTVVGVLVVAVLVVTAWALMSGDNSTLTVGGTSTPAAPPPADSGDAGSENTTPEYSIGTTIVSPMQIGDSSGMCVGTHRVALYQEPPTAVAPFVAAAFQGEGPPSGCAEDLNVAADYGYEPYLPEGSEIVSNVVLVPVFEQLRTACTAAADELGFPVACPGLLPAENSPPLCPTRFGQLNSSRCVLSLPAEQAEKVGIPAGDGFGFSVRTGLPQLEPDCLTCTVTVTITGVDVAEPGPWTVCSPSGDEVDPPGLDTVVDCEPAEDDRSLLRWAPHADGSLVRWGSDGEQFALSVTVSGAADVADELALTLAEHTVVVDPS